jgi:hypothetical protein
MEDISRRRVLLGTAGVTTAAIAGCVSGGDDGTDDSSGNGTDDGETGETGSVKRGSITRTGSDCAGQEPDTATVIVEENSYTIEGSLPSPTPCYEPELVDVGYTDGTLSLTVDIVADGSSECVECEGQVDYDATVELSPRGRLSRQSLSPTKVVRHTTSSSRRFSKAIQRLPPRRSRRHGQTLVVVTRPALRRSIRAREQSRSPGKF